MVPARPLVSGAGRVGQVEHDGGVGGLEADSAGRRVDECRVTVCHDPVAWGEETGSVTSETTLCGLTETFLSLLGDVDSGL